MSIRKKLLVIGIVLTAAAGMLGHHYLVCALDAFQILVAGALVSTIGM
jgi:hypothetical protein